MSVRSQTEARFIELLSELFQLDEAEALDFGIYRIIRRHNREVCEFLGQVNVEGGRKVLAGGRLSSLLDTAFTGIDDERIAQARARVTELETALSIASDTPGEARDSHLADLEKIPATVPLIKEYRRYLDELADTGAADLNRAEVLNHLYEFFSRHYQDGDFIVERRYGNEGSRYIRSTGEDTEFHRATDSMFYIKSGDVFTDFPVRLTTGGTIVFSLDPESLKATRASLKPTDKAHYELDSITVQDDCRTFVRLKYLKGTQTDRHKERIIEAIRTSAGGEASEIKRWLNRFVARNQSDFFIHGNLKAALLADLDIFVKTEVLDADQLLADGDLPKRVAKIGKIVKAVAEQIIGFLASLEDFQKAIWKKKKLVLEQGNCI